MSVPGEEPEAEDTTGAADEPEPVVIDLRDGVDTVAAYEADQAARPRRASVHEGSDPS